MSAFHFIPTVIVDDGNLHDFVLAGVYGLVIAGEAGLRGSFVKPAQVGHRLPVHPFGGGHIGVAFVLVESLGQAFEQGRILWEGDLYGLPFDRFGGVVPVVYYRDVDGGVFFGDSFGKVIPPRADSPAGRHFGR